MTPTERRLLQRIVDSDGKLLALSVTASGGSMNALHQLLAYGYAEICDHPTVVADRSTGKKAAAIAPTDDGKQALKDTAHE